MDKRIFTIILAIVLIGCFFLPYYSAMGTNMSGFDIVKSQGGDWKKYIPALIPLSGLMLLIGALNNGNYPGGRGLWAWLPLLTIIFMLIALPAIDGTPIKLVLKSLGKEYGIGLWVTIAASVILAFYNPRSRA
jgi:hypothetical protein